MGRIFKINQIDDLYMKSALLKRLEGLLKGWTPEVPVVYSHESNFLELDTLEGFHDDFAYVNKSNVIQAAINICYHMAHGDKYALPENDTGLYLLQQAILDHTAYFPKKTECKTRATEYYSKEFWSSPYVLAWLICIVWDWYGFCSGRLGYRKWCSEAAKVAYDEQPPQRYD